jgi:acyl carrier protein
MTRVTIEDLAAVLRRVLAQPRLAVARDTTADDIPGWDSLNHMFIVMEIEARFHVPVSAEEVAALPNIGALCDLIAERLGGSR